jgi:hypothetical protein
VDDEQVIPELGDGDSFEEWNHYEPPEDEGWLDPDVARPPVVDDLRPGETLDERNARLIRQQDRERQADRPEGTKSNPPPDRLVVYVEGKPYALGGERPTRSRIRGSAVKVTDAEGTESWREIGVDDEAIRAFVEAHGLERGFSLEDLRRPFRAGRQRPKERLRRRVLAEIVTAADDAGAKTSALEKVLGLDRRRISELRGSESTPALTRTKSVRK